MGVCQAKVCVTEVKRPGVEGVLPSPRPALRGWRGGELSAQVVLPSPTPSLGALSKMAPGLRGRPAGVHRPSQGEGGGSGRGCALPRGGRRGASRLDADGGSFRVEGK